MKTKNILMTLLLAVGAIAAKANGFPPELALVSQPVMVYNYNSITVYYDVENIGDYTYRGDICIFLDPDDGYSYAEEYVKVRPGRIKRIAVEIPSYRIDRHFTYTIMPYYTIGNELYSFTTFEYFEPIRFCWHGPRTEPWVVIHIGPRIRYYHRPGNYRYYYDGFRPPMPPPGHEPRPMDPMHHTYGFHHNNGGYPATHNEWSDKPEPAPNSNEPAPSPTVRPKVDGGSMSSGSYNSGNTVTPNNGGSSSNRPKVDNGSSSSGRTGNGTSTRPTTNNGSASGRTGNSGSTSGRVNNSSSNSRSNGTSGSSSSRVNGSNSSNRSSGNSGSSSSRVNSSSNSTRTSGNSSSSSRSGSSSTRNSSSSSSRSGSGSGRR